MSNVLLIKVDIKLRFIGKSLGRGSQDTAELIPMNYGHAIIGVPHMLVVSSKQTLDLCTMTHGLF